jgi:glycosyltransferase involved in cell wall biosynthesis
MAMAKPSVSSSIGETQRIIIDGENGMLARSRDEFIGRMEKLIENPELRRDMGVRARQTAERDYSLQVLCRRLYDIVVSR